MASEQQDRERQARERAATADQRAAATKQADETERKRREQAGEPVETPAQKAERERKQK